jgi:hypothetical protein
MRNFLPTLAAVVAVTFAAGLCSHSSFAQEPRQAGDSGLQVGPEERAAIWDSLQGLSPREWRQRMEEWRTFTPEQRRERIERLREAAPPPPAEQLPEKPEKYIDRWQYRSALTIGDTSQFSLRNPWEEQTFWASAGETRHEIEIVSHDPERDALTIRHGDDTKELSLARSRVAELPAGFAWQGHWQQRMAEQAEQFRAFRERWAETATNAPKLQEIEAGLRELRREFGAAQRAMRDLAAGSAERERLESHQRELIEEAQLLTEMAQIEMRNHPAFTEEDHRMVRGIGRSLMFVGTH